MSYPERALPPKRKRKSREVREAREDAIDSRIAAQRLREFATTGFVILVGDIVTGFEAYGPFESGHDAVTWKQSAGNREMCQGQWYLMQLKPPIPGKD